MVECLQGIKDTLLTNRRCLLKVEQNQWEANLGDCTSFSEWEDWVMINI